MKTFEEAFAALTAEECKEILGLEHVQDTEAILHFGWDMHKKALQEEMQTWADIADRQM